MSLGELEKRRIPWENIEAERFLANRHFWEYINERQATREPWEFDEQKPEKSIQSLGELRRIALLTVSELDFLSPPVLWYGNSRRALRWGHYLIEGNFSEWKKVKRKSASIWVAIFYPSAKRNYDFMLCVNRYTPLAITRILDAEVLSNSTKLESICKSVGLQFESSAARPILLPQDPRNCTPDEVRSLVEKLGLFKKGVACSIRELGEFFRFI